MNEPIITRPLAASRTYRDRSYDLFPPTDFVSDFALEIRQGLPHRKNYSCERYAVQELPAPHPDARLFLVAKDMDAPDEMPDVTGDDPDPGPYETVVAPRGVRGCCTCQGGRMAGNCKHLDALRDLVEVVGLPRPAWVAEAAGV